MSALHRHGELDHALVGSRPNCDKFVRQATPYAAWSIQLRPTLSIGCRRTFQPENSKTRRKLIANTFADEPYGIFQWSKIGSSTIALSDDLVGSLFAFYFKKCQKLSRFISMSAIAGCVCAPQEGAFA